MDKNYLIYPTKVMNITQGYNDSFSHQPYSSGTPADYPIDDCCSGSGRDYFYCPCDEMKIVRIYGVGNSGTNSIWLESTSKVIGPFGEDYITILVIHPEDDDLSKLKVGQIFKRGEAMFREGKDGFATGYHFHIVVGTGKIIDDGWTRNSNNVWVNDTTGKQLKPEEAFYIDPSFTKIQSSKNIKFQNLPTNNTIASSTRELYRVRKTWEDNKSQVGAYSNLNNAIKACDKAGSDYYIFNNKGECIYPKKVFTPYLVKINTLILNIRKGPGIIYDKAGFVYMGQVFTIVEEKDGFGKLKSGAGWISLDYTKKV